MDASSPMPAVVPDRSRFRLFTICAIALIAAFAVPLWQLIRHALDTDLQSHILLVPFMSAYLFRIAPKPQPGTPPSSSILGGCVAALFGLVTLALYCSINGNVDQNDRLSVVTFSFLAFQLAGALFFLGWPL